MKAPVRVRSSWRAAVVAAAGLAALTTLSGCGFETRQQAAAVVNGQVIHESDVQETSRQLSEAKGLLQDGQKIPDTAIVTWLVASPMLDEALEVKGGWTPNPEYARVMSLIPDASQSTKDFIRAVVQINSADIREEVDARYAELLDEAKISVNPRYGVVTPSAESPLRFSLSASQPNWIAPFDSDAAGDQTSGNGNS